MGPLWGGLGQFFLAQNESRIYPNMCAKFGCGPTVVSKKRGGYRQTDRQTKKTAALYSRRQRHQPEILFSHTSRARKCIKFYIPLLLRSMPTCIIDKIYTHSLNGFSNYTKQYMLAGYENSCQTRNCYVCAHA